MATHIERFDIAVIGGGIVGLYTALDLTLRGFKVVLLERGTIGSGTSGRMHGLLHSGARYAVRDPSAAVECASESKILSEVAQHAIENTGGYFVAVEKEDEDYLDDFLKGLRSTGISHRLVDPGEALEEEPNLSRSLRAVVEVPDMVVRAVDMLGSVALSAYIEGARILEDAEVVGFKVVGGSIEEISVRDNISGSLRSLRAELIVNASGPWAGKVASMAGASIDIMPTAGSMIVIPARLSRRVINRLRPPSDGDIVVPYSGSSIVGTTARVVEDPDYVEPDEDEIELLIEEGSKMLPMIRRIGYTRVYHSIRPLLRAEGARAGREATRDFKIFRHVEPRNMVSVVGGKFTTGRLIAEKVSDEASKILGSSKASRTRGYRLRQASEEDLADMDPGFKALVMGICDKKLLDYERLCGAIYRVIAHHISMLSRKDLGWVL
ncbi:MAG: FAD-dependent oxidoreductase [Sulfolobales archaeon]